MPGIKLLNEMKRKILFLIKKKLQQFQVIPTLKQNTAKLAETS